MRRQLFAADDHITEPLEADWGLPFFFFAYDPHKATLLIKCKQFISNRSHVPAHRRFTKNWFPVRPKLNLNRMDVHLICGTGRIRIRILLIFSHQTSHAAESKAMYENLHVNNGALAPAALLMARNMVSDCLVIVLRCPQRQWAIKRITRMRDVDV